MSGKEEQDMCTHNRVDVCEAIRIEQGLNVLAQEALM